MWPCIQGMFQRHRQRLIPRQPPKRVSRLFVNYLTFIRRTERVFGALLQWDPAVLKFDLFYRPKGKRYSTSGQFGIILRKTLVQHLHCELGIAQYRHIATALGRMALAEELQAIRALELGHLTNGMDALAGWTSSQSSKRYAIDREQHGNIDTVGMELYQSCNTAWHHRVLQQDVPQRLLRVQRIDDNLCNLIDAIGTMVFAVLPVETSRVLGAVFKAFGEKLLSSG